MMYTYYHPNQRRHDPGVLPQPEGGSHHYYSEVAQRGELLLQALQAAAFGPVVAPEDHGMAPLAAVHSAEMLTLLQNAYQRMVHEVHGGHHHPRVVLPETFAVRRNAGHVPHSIWAHLGYFCYDTSSPIFMHTWDAAYWSAQCAVSAAERTLHGDRAAYAICRPPGHHASRDMFGGFCYLNNVAIAANWLTKRGQRVAVLDIDYHHGNGTQEIFYARDDVLTISLHVDPHEDYPYFWGHADETGVNLGTGCNLNLPLPRTVDAAGYMVALDIALYRVHEFAPDSLLIALGMDTYKGDPVGGFDLDTPDYTAIGKRIAALGVPVIVTQEGGYHLDSLAGNVTSFLTGLLSGQ